MTERSLGALLRAQTECAQSGCLRELEQAAARKGICAERDLQVVKDFFHRAITQFTTDILARTDLRPMLLGNGQNDAASAILQTYRWKRENGMAQASHPYHAAWLAFTRWCTDNELEPVLDYHCDGLGKLSWHQLTVRPADATSRHGYQDDQHALAANA